MRIERDIHNNNDITTTPRNLCGAVDSAAHLLSAIALCETVYPSTATHTFSVSEDLLGDGDCTVHNDLSQVTNKRKIITPDQSRNTDSSTGLSLTRKRACASKVESLIWTMSPKINLKIRHEHMARNRDDLLSFFIESLSEVKDIPADPVLTHSTSSDLPSTSTHVTAFASMMTCASFWDEFVSMDQEVKKKLRVCN